jgi:hypothetical protein
MSARPYFTSVCLALTTVLAAAREFTDIKGRKLEGDIVAASGSLVSIKRAADGKTFTVPATTFGPDDQKFISEYAATNVRHTFDVKYSKIKLGKTKERDGPVTYETEEWAYKISLTNRSSVDLSDATVAYWLFRKPDDGGSTVGPARIDASGTNALQLLKKSASLEFQSNSYKLRKEQLDADYYNPDGTPNGKRDAAGGLAIRIFKGDKPIFEWASKPDLLKATPSKLPTRVASESSSETSK